MPGLALEPRARTIRADGAWVAVNELISMVDQRPS